MRWLNPLVWFSALWQYVKQHFVAWHLSEGITWAKAALLSFAVPNWARDAWETAPVVWDQTVTTCKVLAEVCVELFQNTS